MNHFVFSTVADLLRRVGFARHRLVAGFLHLSLVSVVAILAA